MTSCRDGVSLASYGGYLFAIGGIDGPSYLNSVEYYDPDNDTWIPSQAMITSRAAAGVAVLNNEDTLNCRTPSKVSEKLSLAASEIHEENTTHLKP